MTAWTKKRTCANCHQIIRDTVNPWCFWCSRVVVRYSLAGMLAGCLLTWGLFWWLG